TSAHRNRRRVPRKSHCVSQRYGRAWALQGTVPALRTEGATHSLRVERNELLSQVSDGRQASRRSRTLAPVARGLAEVYRRTFLTRVFRQPHKLFTKTRARIC